MKASIINNEFLDEQRAIVRPSTFKTTQSWMNRYIDRWLPTHGYPDADISVAESHQSLAGVP